MTYKEIGKQLIDLRQIHRDEIEFLEKKFQKAFEKELLEKTGIGKAVIVTCAEGKEYIVEKVTFTGLGLEFSLVRALRYRKNGTLYTRPFVRSAKFFTPKTPAQK